MLAEKLNVKPNEILYIDDSLTNIKAAEEANLNSYLYINNELFKKYISETITLID
jgi:FMN phosphatase YigB (HAD superfamily)